MGGGLHKPNGGGSTTKAPKGGHQRRSPTGFSVRHVGGAGKKGTLDLSQWSNSSEPSVGSAPRGGANGAGGGGGGGGGGGFAAKGPTKRKHGSSQHGGAAASVMRPYPKALPQNAEIQFEPSVLAFEPFKPVNDAASAVVELQVCASVRVCVRYWCGFVRVSWCARCPSSRL